LTRKQVWGGRFEAPLSEALKRLNDSFSFDFLLLEEELQASTAWARALAAAGVLNAEELKQIVDGLETIARDFLPLTKVPNTDVEDVHSFVEAELTRRIGALGGKLHTGRSRNDQVATDLRLYLRKALAEAKGLTLEVALALANRAEAEAATPMPGYTHLKQAEPITFGHWCLAYTEMLLRDASRMQDARERADECPLGSGALAGTPVPVDRQALAADLGFSRPTANSLDAVSDRDCAADYLFAATMLLGHLSRFAEDLIVYSTDEFGFVELPDSLATGSSRMPQKKNPDLLELTRGHAARTIGELTGLLGILKGLPLAYDKDLQLDKEPVFRTRAVLAAVLPALAELVEGLQLRRSRMLEMASRDNLLATELADALARRGVPFRKAHEIVGHRIAQAVFAGKTVAEMGPTDEITAADLQSMNLESSLSRKNLAGGTAPNQVRAAAAAARKAILEMQSKRAEGVRKVR
jgi:argininosuccinate lyase